MWIIAAVAGVYWPSLAFDLYEDDLYDLRPWPPELLAGVWSGPWTPNGLHDYFRPLAVWSFHLMFEAFGWNTSALHVMALVTLAVVAWLVGHLVLRESGSRALGTVASLLYVVHPATAVAGGPWIVNQYQAVIPAMTIAALLVWHRWRDRSGTGWALVVVPIVVAALTKENGLMVPLMLCGIAWSRRVWLGEVTRDPWRRGLVIAGVFVALNVWRMAALGWQWPQRASDYGVWEGLLGGAVVFFWHPVVGPPTAWSLLFAVISTVVTGAGLYALVRRTSRPAVALVLTGLVILVCASLPSALVFSRERLIPHGLGVVLIWSGGLLTMGAWLQTRWKTAAVLVAIPSVAATVLMTRTAIEQFNPCHVYPMPTPQDARWVLEEVPLVPPEVVPWLVAHPRPCDPAQLTPFYKTATTLTWNVVEQGSAPEGMVQDLRYSEVVALVTPSARSVVVTLRHPDATADQPVVVHVSGSGGAATSLTLDSSEWKNVTVPLAPDLGSWLRRMYRVEIEVPGFRGSGVPGGRGAEVPRFRGIQMRPLEVVR